MWILTTNSASLTFHQPSMTQWLHTQAHTYSYRYHLYPLPYWSRYALFTFAFSNEQVNEWKKGNENRKKRFHIRRHTNTSKQLREISTDVFRKFMFIALWARNVCGGCFLALSHRLRLISLKKSFFSMLTFHTSQELISFSSLKTVARQTQRVCGSQTVAR